MSTDTDPNEPDPAPVDPDPAPVEPDTPTIIVEDDDEGADAGGSTANTAADVTLGQYDQTQSGDDEPDPDQP